MAVSFTRKSNVADTTRASINKKGADLFIKGIFKPEQSDKYTSFFLQIIQIFLDAKISKVNRVTIFSKNVL